MKLGDSMKKETVEEIIIREGYIENAEEEIERLKSLVEFQKKRLEVLKSGEG